MTLSQRLKNVYFAGDKKDKPAEDAAPNFSAVPTDDFAYDYDGDFPF